MEPLNLLSRIVLAAVEKLPNLAKSHLSRKRLLFETPRYDCNGDCCSYEQPTQAGLSESNVGSRMMSKMGWTKGKGLGRSNQGIVDPIEATRRQRSAGLGASGSRTVANILPGDSYKECVKKTMFARFHELD
jgi:hypothetical protein